MKNIANLRKYIKYLFFIGIFLWIAGLVAGLVSGTWSLLPVGLLVAGIFIIVLWLGFLISFTQGFWGRRSTEAGTNALVATLAVLVILGLINFLALRYSVRVDLTENQLFTLSPQSQQILQNLQQPLKVWVFDRDPNPADQDLLENYRRNGSNFEFEFVDPQVKIGLAREFNVQSFGDVYVEYGSKRQLVQTLNPGARLSEVKLTNAIEQIKRDRNQYIYFLQGHGERTLQADEGGLSQAVTSLEDKGYIVQPLNLAERAEVPEDATAIVVAGPKRALFEGEVKVLKDYLDQGGKLLLMLDPNTNPGLEPLLKDWGIELDDRLIIDASGAGNLIGLGPAIPLVTSYGNHPITEDFASGISVYPLARPIGTIEVEGVEPVALLLTNEQSWAESDLEAQELEFDPTEDIEGPFDLGVAFTRTKSEAEGKSEEEKETAESPEPSPSPSPDASEENENEAEVAESPESSPSPSPDASEENQEKDKQEKPESRLVVFGNSTFATNGWFEQQLNGDVFLNSVNWLASSGDEQTLSIRPKEPKNRRINLTSQQAAIIGWMALIIIPLLGFITAGATWWRRR
ncbi:MAG: Gldg family protein [Xenococcaceae cyanobacterium]